VSEKIVESMTGECEPVGITIELTDLVCRAPRLRSVFSRIKGRADSKEFLRCYIPNPCISKSSESNGGKLLSVLLVVPASPETARGFCSARNSLTPRCADSVGMGRVAFTSEATLATEKEQRGSSVVVPGEGLECEWEVEGARQGKQRVECCRGVPPTSVERRVYGGFYTPSEVLASESSCSRVWVFWEWVGERGKEGSR
jgi:hypothetical protein